jgi:hypothetical protein
MEAPAAAHLPVYLAAILLQQMQCVVPAKGTAEVSLPGQRQQVYLGLHIGQHLLLSNARTRTRLAPAAGPRDVRDGFYCFDCKDPAGRLHARSHVSSAPVERAVLCMPPPQHTCKLHISLL